MEDMDVFEPPAEHVVARCQECDSVVWKCTQRQAFGMAESCDEHEPLCHLQDGGCRD